MRTPFIQTTPEVESSLVKHAAYYDGGDLEVEFHSGRRYVYFDVEPFDAVCFLMADSLGRAYNKLIKGRYQNWEAMD